MRTVGDHRIRPAMRVLDAHELVVGYVRAASEAGLVVARLYGRRPLSISFEDVDFVTDDEVRLRTTHHRLDQPRA